MHHSACHLETPKLEMGYYSNIGVYFLGVFFFLLHALFGAVCLSLMFALKFEIKMLKGDLPMVQ